ncbi:MAG: type II secretion system protein [Phycisphaeraceae bacterium]|nr:MAG: type II secretion system protein [Phycisphaeraceae bacterium]
MTHPRSDNPIHAECGPGAPRRSFTLTELLVAIGVVALMSVAIGQIFQTIGRIVSTGSAIAEVDQVARAIERQLRDDFDSLNRMPPDETFIAIRMREIGDVNRNERVDQNQNERAIYLTREDREADLRDGLDPYEVNGQLRSRAVTRRLDEIIFLAASPPGGLYVSQQLDHDKNPGSRDSRLIPRVATQAARIYIGHAMRPGLDTDENRNRPPATPLRQYYPDGYDNPNLTFANRQWGAFFGAENTRNEFGADWMLTRQPMLLFGGAASGQGSNFRSVAPIGNGREFSPFIRETENIARFPQTLFQLWTDEIPPNELDLIEDLHLPDDPEERLMSWGRVDIAAQNIDDVRRWLEGEAPGWMPGRLPSAVPFDAGLLRDPDLFDSGDDFDLMNSPLWTRVDSSTLQVTPQRRLQRNLAGLFSAIAGVFFRPLQESAPPIIERYPTRNIDEVDQLPPGFQPSDALMDTHALLAARCSNFEVAWSDGSTALRDIRIGGRTILNAGDLIWFDISPVDPDANSLGNDIPGPGRSTYEWWATTNQIRRDDVQLRSYAPSLIPPPEAERAYRFFPPDFPEISIRRILTSPTMRITDRANGVFTGDGSGLFSGVAPYNIAVTGGAPGAQASPFRAEYLAIWPFRTIDQNGNYTGPWRKNLHIRIRMTLHDAQGRLPDGRTYEFIFRVNPGLGT